MIAKDAEFDIVVSGVAYDVISARADFVQEIGCACGDLADWGGDGVGAADADGLVHVAHDGKCVEWSWVCFESTSCSKRCSKLVSQALGNKPRKSGLLS